MHRRPQVLSGRADAPELNPEEVKAAVVGDEWSRRRKADASPEPWATFRAAGPVEAAT
jgi:hypothetical protein